MSWVTLTRSPPTVRTRSAIIPVVVTTLSGAGAWAAAWKLNATANTAEAKPEANPKTARRVCIGSFLTK